jgi:putative aldouronate transport system substrate-binding protein
MPYIGKSIISTGSVQGSGYAISIYSKHKEQAMQFMNLWYTDPKLATLMAYGIEGNQYTTNSDGTITFTDNHAAYSPWRNGMGNIFILPETDTEGKGYYDGFKKYNEEGTPVALLGFTFDTEPVKNQIASLNNVRDQYVFALNTGSVDPDTQLPEFLSKLKSNGMDDVVAEANKQVQAFLASKTAE